MLWCVVVGSCVVHIDGHRYHSPDSQAYHRFVWQQVDAKFVQPYLLRFVPQAQKPISLIQAYFLKP